MKFQFTTAFYLGLFLIFTTFITELPAQQLTVMTYNIHHGRNEMNEVDLPAIAEVIKSSGAELIGLQEVDSVCRRSGNVDQMKVLGDLTGMHYNFQKHYDFDGGSYGLGILSKYPIENVKNYSLTYSLNDINSDNRILMVADIQLGKSRTIHFATVHFDHREDPGIRSLQSAETFNFLKNLKNPVILTGDLNAEPEKPEIRDVIENFADTDDTGAFTFPSDKPNKKIDYILISKPHLKKVVKHEVIDEPVASDHRPVIATVVLKK
ncbi:endonuclease/exonuclease/phosphatase family protein [soil metagenome]